MATVVSGVHGFVHLDGYNGNGLPTYYIYSLSLSLSLDLWFVYVYVNIYNYIYICILFNHVYIYIYLGKSCSKLSLYMKAFVDFKTFTKQNKS